jgi:nucleoside-diphosphate-sugar epimerase
MRVFLAGGSGVVGRPLVAQLLAAGHQVAATTRTPGKAAQISAAGAAPVVVDALDAQALTRAVHDARPDAIVHQLTALPPRYDPSRPGFYDATNRLRTEATRTLLAAGEELGVRRYLFQSVCFLYKLTGPQVLDESAPVATDSPEPFGAAARLTIEGEQMIAAAGGVVLRYGQLYGPGTYYTRDGDFGRRARRRLLPVVGDGGGVFSFLHVEDAASAAVAALSRGAGVYNVADDEPAAYRDWLPVFCDAVGAPKPMRVPVWLGKLAGGSFAVANLLYGRGASNAKAKAELGWTPSRPSWRTGFYEMASADAGAASAR